MIFLNDIMSVLGLDSGYTVKYNHQEFPWASSLGTPSDKGLYLTVYPLFRPDTNTLHPPENAISGNSFV